ncbi:hypothetical protein BSKO_12142 [Bryopsis sp. KO-2023]|nr:hypothetical protein BSKO_12142 [Bryopsis sp. KO-2023]
MGWRWLWNVPKLRTFTDIPPAFYELPNGVWHKIEEFEGNRTELYGVDALSLRERPDLQVVFLPGNPGACRYYTHFLKFLHSALGGRASVVGVSYLGHESGFGLHAQRTFSLREQIKHKQAVLKSYCENFDGKTVVIGHSIGAYMALKSVDHLQTSTGGKSDIEYVALFPFLACDPFSSRQKGLKALAALDALGVVNGTSWVLSFLPRPILELLTRLVDGTLDPHAVAATTGLISRDHVKNACHLARCEFRELEHFDLDLVRDVAENMILLHTPGDTWFPDWQQKEIEKSISKIRMHNLEGFVHGFPVSVSMSESLANIIVKIISGSKVQGKIPLND